MPLMSDIQSNSMCQGCGLQIKDQYIFKVMPDMQWHESCLKCAECSCKLTDSCFVRNSKTYCRQDYTRLLATSSLQPPVNKSCHKCGIQLKRNDLIMKSKEKMFHMECFKCNICARKLMPGDEYCHQPLDDLLYCKEDALMASLNHSPKFLMNNNNTNQVYLSTNRFHSNSLNNMSISTESSSSSSSSSSCSYSPSTTSSSITDSPSSSSHFNGHINNSFHSLLPSNSSNNFQGLIEHGNINRNSSNNNTYEFDAYHHDKEDEQSISDDEEQEEDDEDDEENMSDDDNDDSLTDEDSSFNESNSKSKKH